MVMNQGAFRDMLSSVRGEEKARALDVDLPPQFGRAHGSNLRVALVGRPNVGKSSLLNKATGTNRAVVNDLAGTTRDPIDEQVEIAGKIWRFGIMGYSCRPDNVMLCLSALGSVLSDMGLPVHVGDAEAAAHGAYASMHAKAAQLKQKKRAA